VVTGGKKKMGKKAKTRLIGRSAITGRFMSVKRARSQKRTSVVERIKRA